MKSNETNFIRRLHRQEEDAVTVNIEKIAITPMSFCHSL